MIKFSALETICGGTLIRLTDDREVTDLIIDSRKSIVSDSALFFAVKGERHDAHRFLSDMYARGFRQFVVEKMVDDAAFPEANILFVRSSVEALQALVAHHRKQFSIPVIGITGSNGKTIIKEWLYQLLSPDYNIVKNPGSYNSQIGVPLSVWQIQSRHQLGIFEAGISMPGEMKRLEQVTQPTIGIFTAIGPAHAEGFENEEQKIREKLLLFRNAEVMVYNSDQLLVGHELKRSGNSQCRFLSWGKDESAAFKVTQQEDNDYRIIWQGGEFIVHFPFANPASIQNACHCLVIMLYLGYSPERIQERMLQLKTVPMRLELKQGINHCQIIDDTYNNDLSGLQISLDFLSGLQKKKSTLILSDILQSGLEDAELVRRIAALVLRSGVSSFIGIGSVISTHRQFFEKVTDTIFFPDTTSFLEMTDMSRFHDEAILVKGARIFQFEKIVHLLQKKIHGTVMEIDLGAMVHNLNYFRSRLKKQVKLMVMVKAFAYGSGSEEVANLLQYHHVDYLGVAYADEGVELRKNGIRLPIMVMNPSEESFPSLIANGLEPEIYSIAVLKSFAVFLGGMVGKIHIKIDTGMHRLGFEEIDLPEAIAILMANPNMQIVSIFSHLAGADEPEHDEFTRAQATRFLSLSSRFSKELKINPILHLVNSSGILRFPEFQLGMVRLGIGLYGVDPTEGKENYLEPVATLKSVISQIRHVSVGESIGYGRKGNADKGMTIATIAIGYADGFNRRFSRGNGSVLIKGLLAPVVGNVCMDMTMVDVTGIPVREGDEVIIFGKDLPIGDVAKRINTIPYEILTSTSGRVKRIFYAESI